MWKLKKCSTGFVQRNKIQKEKLNRYVDIFLKNCAQEIHSFYTIHNMLLSYGLLL